MSRSIATIIFCLLIFGISCKQQPASKRAPLAKTEQSLNGISTVTTTAFDLHPIFDKNVTPSTQLYECLYQYQGKTARFRLQLNQLQEIEGDIAMSLAEGKLQAVNGSDNSVLLEHLKVDLEASTIPAKVKRIAEVPFDAVILGVKQSQNNDGSYSANPPGDWTTLKLFFPKGGDDAEVFLNVNPVLGKGEFSIKDSGYGDYLLKEFAKVL